MTVLVVAVVVPGHSQEQLAHHIAVDCTVALHIAADYSGALHIVVDCSAALHIVVDCRGAARHTVSVHRKIDRHIASVVSHTGSAAVMVVVVVD